MSDMSDTLGKYEYISRNVSLIREKINASAQKNGRDTNDITLLAAVKYADTDEINYLHKECGINDIGENRVQQLLERYDSIDKNGLRIHFIGKLQTNKVKYIIDKVDMIHSLDSEKLAAEIEFLCNSQMSAGSRCLFVLRFRTRKRI